jgi:succinate-acetate transporter protein
MFFGTLRENRCLQTVFLSLTVLFFLLAAAEWAGSPLMGRIAGVEGIACGFSAICLAMAEVLNEVYERTVLPIG